VDNGDGVRNLVVSPQNPFSSEFRKDLLGGVVIVRGPAVGLHRTKGGGVEEKPVELVAVPYYVNCNRQASEMLVWLAETPKQAVPLPVATIANRARASASHCWPTDTIDGLNDGVEPAASDDAKIPRFTWWDHRGTKEWVQYDFNKPQKVSGVSVYWWDERRVGAHCRVPQSWRVLYQDGDQWKPVTGATAYGTSMDRYNRVTFDGIDTAALRLEVQLQPTWSGGILEWQVE
jgi:hypothetical protein